jgi:protein-tyrosine phosphatase
MTETTRVCFVCLGNICRSPLAHGVFQHLVEQAGLDDRVFVDSCGTSSYHQGEPPDPGSVRVARKHGLDISDQASRPLRDSDFQRFRWIVVMDGSNQRDTEARAKGRRPVHQLRDFDPQGPGAVPDPWGGGRSGFDTVYEMVERSCHVLLDRVAAEL